jgi:hypothetical protein
MNKPIQIENQIIIKNLDEIVEIISTNIQKMNIDETLLDLILQFITHVLAYKCLKQLNIKYRHIFSSDIDKNAKKVILYNHSPEIFYDNMPFCLFLIFNVHKYRKIYRCILVKFAPSH